MNLRPAFSVMLLAGLATGCSDPSGPEPLPEGCSRLVRLDHPLGAFVRLKGAGQTTYPCLLLEAPNAGNHEYILLFENLSPTGGFSAALFPGPATDTSLTFTVDVEPRVTTVAAGATVNLRAPSAPDYTWDFGAGRLREHHPELPAGLVIEPRLLRADTIVPLNSARADPVIGDTIQIRMEALPRLGIPAGNQKAVIRFVSDDLIVAEDLRLWTTLVRQGGGNNTPISDEDLAGIAAEYSAVARVQGDIFFQNRHNSAVEASVPNRVVAVHSLMPGDSIWGYTYSVHNYFVFDFWVATDGSTKGLNQHPQRVADNLFMHEIAHMRHFGLLQRNGLGVSDRGNSWLVEGFARFGERLPIAARLLGTTAPSRTANLILPRNPAFNNNYFMDDVPTYLHASSSLYFGYHTSAFLFDYFADQVALLGGDWMVALREFLVAGNSQSALDAVVQRWLPGNTFADLVTRSRIALYTDDIDTAGLPAWTQYHQYRLRDSRPAPSQAADQDPRAQWTRVSAGARNVITGSVRSGGAAGFIIARDNAPSTLLRLSGPAAPHAHLSIARIR